MTKGQQDLYLHPSSFSGVLDEDNIQSLQEQLSKAQAFRCYHVDCYEEYRDLSDKGCWAELEAKRDEITEYILKKCRQEIPTVESGSFGAHMNVSLVNDGPFTVILDSNELNLQMN